MPTSLRATIFDMDGTLVDNMSFHNSAWEALSTRLGVPTAAARFQREFAGKKSEEILGELLGREVSPAELTRLAGEKEALYRDTYRPHLTLLRGAGDFLRRLRAHGVKTAVATAAPLANRELVLDGLGLRPSFDRVVGAEEVARGKPAPDIFLLAAKDLGLAPRECVVFEDAANGVSAGRAAGMVVVGMTTATSARELLEAGATETAPDFASLSEGLLAKLGL